MTVGTMPSVVLTQVMSNGYLKMQDNFFNFMEDNTPYMKQKLFLLCMDDESVTYMSNLGVRCVEIDRSISVDYSERKVVWVIRMKVSEGKENLGVLARCLRPTPVDVIGNNTPHETWWNCGVSRILVSQAVLFVILSFFEETAIIHVEMSSTTMQCHIRSVLDIPSLFSEYYLHHQT